MFWVIIKTKVTPHWIHWMYISRRLIKICSKVLLRKILKFKPSSFQKNGSERFGIVTTCKHFQFLKYFLHETIAANLRKIKLKENTVCSHCEEWQTKLFFRCSLRKQIFFFWHQTYLQLKMLPLIFASLVLSKSRFRKSTYHYTSWLVGIDFHFFSTKSHYTTIYCNLLVNYLLFTIRMHRLGLI